MGFRGLGVWGLRFRLRGYGCSVEAVALGAWKGNLEGPEGELIQGGSSTTEPEGTLRRTVENWGMLGLLGHPPFLDKLRAWFICAFNKLLFQGGRVPG